MPHFICENTKLIVSTNYKVMYSWFVYQSGMREMNAYESKKRLLFHKMRLSNYRHVFIMRDPYDRLVSFYKDKFVGTIKRIKVNPEINWQYCHKIFFNYFKIIENDDREMATSKFLNCTFEEFINLIPSHYLLDGHLYPQNLLLKKRIKGSLVQMRYDYIFNMNSESYRLFLNNTFGLEKIAKVENRTYDLFADLNITYNTEMINIVNKIYQEDFNLFKKI